MKPFLRLVYKLFIASGWIIIAVGTLIGMFTFGAVNSLGWASKPFLYGISADYLVVVLGVSLFSFTFYFSPTASARLNPYLGRFYLIKKIGMALALAIALGAFIRNAGVYIFTPKDGDSKPFMLDAKVAQDGIVRSGRGLGRLVCNRMVTVSVGNRKGKLRFCVDHLSKAEQALLVRGEVVVVEGQETDLYYYFDSVRSP